jgi:hypothetical protein
LEELKIEPIDEKLRKFKLYWVRHVTGMDIRMPKIMLNYRQDGRRRLGRPLKRLTDKTETGLSRHNSLRIMTMMTNGVRDFCLTAKPVNDSFLKSSRIRRYWDRIRR